MENIIADLVRYYDTRGVGNLIAEIVQRDGDELTYMNSMWLVCWLSNEAEGRCDLNESGTPQCVLNLIRSSPVLTRLFAASRESLSFRDEISAEERKELLDYVLTHHKPYCGYVKRRSGR
jgi:hypothetical protein